MPIRSLPPDLMRVARDELHEDVDPIRAQERIDQLKDWVLSQHHIQARMDDQWFVAFLRGAKFNMDRAKKKIELYYKLRSSAKELVWALIPVEPRFMKLLAMGPCLALPKASNTHPRIILLRPGHYDRHQFTLTDMLCVFYHMMQILVNEDDTVSVVGIRFLIDYRSFTLPYMTQVRFSIIRKIIQIAQESWPLRLKGSNHIYMPFYMKSVMVFCRSLLNDKMKRRFVIHGNEEELHEYEVIPREILPKEYGGSGGSLEDITDYWVNKFTEYKDWFKEDQGYGTVDTKKSYMEESALSHSNFLNPNID